MLAADPGSVARVSRNYIVSSVAVIQGWREERTFVSASSWNPRALPRNVEAFKVLPTARTTCNTMEYAERREKQMQH